jgi:ABC-type sugar transport system ATPase subunit
VGVRPEDVLVATEDGDVAEVIISVVEPAGSRNWVDVLWNGLTIKGISGALDNLKEGQKASMKISSTKVVVFDAETERRL